MSAALLTGVALALLASVALNTGYLVQHLGSQHAPTISIARPIATLRGLLRSRLWLLGSTAGMLGWALHVGALSQAPLSLVQAFSAGGLALAVPLGARLMRTRLQRRERAAILAMGGALALLGLGAGGAGVATVPAVALVVFLAVGIGGAAGLAALPVGPRRPHGLGIAAGVLYGCGDVATKAATTAAHTGGLAHGLLSPWTAAIAVASAGGFFCLQRGLQLGSALAVIALMTAVTNVVAIVGGLLVFSEPLGATTATSALHVLALLLVAVAAWRLAFAQARLADAVADVGAPAEDAGACRAPSTAPKPNASACSTPARSWLGGITAAKTMTVPIAAPRTTGRLGWRIPAAARRPSVPAHTHEMP